MPEEGRGSWKRDFWIGVGLCFLPVVLGVVVAVTAGRFFPEAGLWAYWVGNVTLIGFLAWAWKKKRFGILKGFFIFFGIILLLVATCFGLVFFFLKS